MLHGLSRGIISLLVPSLGYTISPEMECASNPKRKTTPKNQITGMCSTSGEVEQEGMTEVKKQKACQYDITRSISPEM